MKVSVLGYGRSGKACADLLLKQGADVFISDKAPEEKIKNQNAKIKNTAETYEKGKGKISFEFGGHTEKVLDADMLVISPGVSLQEPIVLKAKAKGMKVIGELEFGAQFIKGKIIGVTGTNGKTTTSYLIYNILKTAGKDCVICGNMGIPLSQVILERWEQQPEVVVIEISTFQLESIEKFKPTIGVLLNITADHMDRHKDFEEYKELKHRLFLNQTPQDYAVLNYDDPNVRGVKVKSNKLFFSELQKTDLYISPSLEAGQETCHYPTRPTPSKNSTNIQYPVSSIQYPVVYWQGEKLFTLKDLDIKWGCLLDDYLASIAVGKILKIKDSEIVEGLSSFKGVSHRLEEIGVVREVRFINNSMCTNPGAFVAVLKSATQRKPIVIAGGKDKGMPLEIIGEGINKYAKYAILIGEVKEKLAKLVKIQYTLANNMEEAVNKSFYVAEEGDTVLLSPGFASFDWFKDYRDRGEVFKKCVQKLCNL